MRILTLPIDGSLAGRSVKGLLTRELRLSEGLVSRLKRHPDGICLNGKKAYTNAHVAEGDLLTVRLYDPVGMARPAPMQMDLSILYEDADLLLLNKPAGIAVHADSRRPDEVTLENALAAYLPEDVAAHPVSRLDRGTTGIMTWAKSGYIHELLRRQQHTPAFYREYRGVIAGAVQPSAGVIDRPIGMAEGSRLKRAVLPDGAPSLTRYETLFTNAAYSLLKLVPETGRTHQLRVHLASIGHPLVGDWLYGTKAPEVIDRPALHSYSLYLVHPITGQPLSLTAPIPADMAKLLPGLPMDN